MLFEKWKLRDRLLVSVILMAAALVAQGFVAVQVSKKMADNLQKIYNTNIPLNHLKKVSDDFAVNIIGAVQKTRSGLIGWEEGRQVIEDAIKESDENWQAYLHSDISPAEKTQATIVGAELKINRNLMMQLREAYEGKNVKDLEILATSTLYPSIDPLMDNLNQLMDMKWKDSQQYVDQALSNYRLGFFFLLFTVLTSVVIGVGISLMVALGLNRRFQSIVRSLDQSADQMNLVSQKVSGASSELALGAAESASSLEQTSTALGPMADMTRSNAQNATRANQMMEETQVTLSKGSGSVGKTVDAMRVLNESAQKISQILKTIEEIAFQTNILSVNASVEAARAGEHGRGFAVVAEEVRNLSQRCATAAKETSKLLQDNAQEASSGVKISEEARQALLELSERTKQVARLLSEIEQASHEQSKGIQEIHLALEQMQKVTQKNSENAEESATASDDMAQQAGGLRQVVKELVGTVQGVQREGSRVPAGKGDPQEPAKKGIPWPPFGRKKAAVVKPLPLPQDAGKGKEWVPDGEKISV